MSDRGREIAELESRLAALREGAAQGRVPHPRRVQAWEIIAAALLITGLAGWLIYATGNWRASPSPAASSQAYLSDQTDLRTACAAALPRARRAFSGAQALSYRIGGEAFRRQADSAVISCPVKTELGSGLMTVNPTCTDVSSFYCPEPLAVYIAGRPLVPR